MSVTGQQGPQVRPLADVLDVAALGERHRLVVADQSHVAEPLSSSALEPHELYTVCFDTPAAPAIEAMVVGPVTVLAGESFGRIQDPELSGPSRPRSGRAVAADLHRIRTRRGHVPKTVPAG